VLPRAHAQNFSGACQHDNKKNSVNFICCSGLKQQIQKFCLNFRGPPR